jgi:hypothetical protein
VSSTLRIMHVFPAKACNHESRHPSPVIFQIHFEFFFTGAVSQYGRQAARVSALRFTRGSINCFREADQK